MQSVPAREPADQSRVSPAAALLGGGRPAGRQEHPRDPGRRTDRPDGQPGGIPKCFQLTPERILTVAGVGRQRPRIEDDFNSVKNHGIESNHVVGADSNSAHNDHPPRQAAQMLWTLLAHGYFKRLYDWARRATDWALAYAAAEGLRPRRIPTALPPMSQPRLDLSASSGEKNHPPDFKKTHPDPATSVFATQTHPASPHPTARVLPPTFSCFAQPRLGNQTQAQCGSAALFASSLTVVFPPTRLGGWVVWATPSSFG